MNDRSLLTASFAALALCSSLLACSSCTEARRAIVGTLGAAEEYEAPKGGGGESARVRLEEVASGFTQITDVQFPPTSPSHVIVLEKGGEAKLVSLADPAAKKTLFSVDVRTESELGLLGLAFHPRFEANGRFFVNYTPRGGELKTRIAEWRMDPAALDGAHEEKVLLEVAQPYQNHNAGQLAFGPDGYLYIGFGDGGWRADPQGNGQNKQTLLGAMLRVDVDNVPAGKAYGIPADNPFVGASDARPELWAYGLRNPWRYSFDESGRLIVADVGQDAWEEVSVVEKGDNLGWNVLEGRHCFEPKVGCEREGSKLPVFEYPRSEGQSITGGYVYTGARIPALVGKYLVADFVSGRVWALELPRAAEGEARAELLGQWPMLVSTFGRDREGEIYLADFGGGKLHRLAPK